MPETKKDSKPRGPVNFLCFVELDDGRWWLAAADREATSSLALRKEIVAELEAAGTARSGRMVIIPTDSANIITHERTTVVEDKFHKTTLDASDASATPPPVMPAADTEAGIAARAAAAPAPPDALVGSGEAAAHAALRAEAAARETAVLPLDPDDDDHVGRDADPATGLSRRSAAQATPADEGNTVFPIDDD